MPIEKNTNTTYDNREILRNRQKNVSEMEKPSQKHRRQFRDHAKTLQTEEETKKLPSADLSNAFHRTYSLHEVLIVLV